MIRFLPKVLIYFLASSAFSAETASLYQQNCAVCHGEAGDGASHARQGLNPPPRDFTAHDFAQTATQPSIAAIIRHGKPGTAMVAWGSILSDQQVDALAAHIMTNFVAPPSHESVASNTGLDLYQENCSVCHGDDGAGAVWGQESLATPPRNFRTAASRRELSRDRMVAAVSYGKPGTPMPGFATQLDKEQIATVVDYVRQTFMQDSVSQTSTIDDYHQQGMPNNLQGNAARGHAYYLANCVECHGASGDGNGPRAYFIYPRPRNFLDPATRQILNRPRLFSGIKDGVRGKEMPAWGKVLGDQEIADITEFVYRDFINSDSAAK